MLWKWPVICSFSEAFFFIPPTLDLKKNSHKATNNKILAYDKKLIHHNWLREWIIENFSVKRSG